MTGSPSHENPLNSVQDFREFYARFVVRSAGSESERLIAAFATVEREHFLGAGPWPVFAGSSYIDTISADPRLLYQDVLIGIATDRGINNGQPSLHARCLDSCEPAAGDAVIHIGAGTGYYTAILAQLVGADGSVTAFEIAADLAERARQNLRHLRNVVVIGASAVTASLRDADVIYVSAGVTHPIASWLDALRIGGRLIFPLTTNEGAGCMLLATRQPAGTYAASVLCRVAFIPCIGARDDVASRALAVALETRSFTSVRSLHRNNLPDLTAWYAGNDWWLSTASPAQ